MKKNLAYSKIVEIMKENNQKIDQKHKDIIFLMVHDNIIELTHKLTFPRL